MKHKAITKILALMVVLCFSTASIGFAADSAISGLGAVTTVGDSDLLLISYWTGSAFESKKITFANFKTAVGSGSDIGNGTAFQVYHTKSDASAGEWTSTLGATGTRLTAGYFANIYGTAMTAGIASTTAGTLNFLNATNANAFTITSGVSGAAIGWTLPTAAPGGANYLLNVDADGTMGYTDPSTLGGGGGVAGKVCKTITNPSDADNILFDIASARTITKISGVCVGGTSAVITLQDAGADGSGSTSIDDAITMDTDGANGGTISYVVHDGDIIKLDIGTVTGVVTQLMVCYE